MTKSVSKKTIKEKNKKHLLSSANTVSFKTYIYKIKILYRLVTKLMSAIVSGGNNTGKGVCVIVGAGSKWDNGGTEDEVPPSSRFGLGGALCLQFAAKGYHVLCLGRRTQVVDKVAACVRDAGGAATSLSCDVTNRDSVKHAFEVAKSIGVVRCVVYNVGVPMPPGVTFRTLPEPHCCDPEFMNQAFDQGVTGCVRVARNAIPLLLEAGGGSFLISGATMSFRGGARFGCLAPAKAALRSFSQSMWNEYAKQGIHTAHVIIDGVIDSPGTRAFGASNYMECAELASAYVSLDDQPKSVWSHEIQLSTPKSNLGMRL